LTFTFIGALFAQLAQSFAPSLKTFTQLRSDRLDFPFVQAAIAIFIKRAENSFAQRRSAWCVAAFTLVRLGQRYAWQCDEHARSNCPQHLGRSHHRFRLSCACYA
jgi:hypothetical protein